MKRKVAGALSLCALLSIPCRAEPTETQREAQRALIERDRQAAEFSRPELRDMPQRGYAEPLRPDERALRAREREAWLLRPEPQPAPQAQPPLPLPSSLPGGIDRAVDPIPVQGSRS